MRFQMPAIWYRENEQLKSQLIEIIIVRSECEEPANRKMMIGITKETKKG